MSDELDRMERRRFIELLLREVGRIESGQALRTLAVSGRVSEMSESDHRRIADVAADMLFDEFERAGFEVRRR